MVFRLSPELCVLLEARPLDWNYAEALMLALGLALAEL